MNTADLEALLDQKCLESKLALEKERKRDLAACNIEIIVVVSFISLFAILGYYICWGAGYSFFAKQQHDTSVAMLLAKPGPHVPLIQSALAEDGYVSLVDYNNYVEMANAYKLQVVPADPGLVGLEGGLESSEEGATVQDVKVPTNVSNSATESASNTSSTEAALSPENSDSNN
ncbi:hypothetical protein [Agarilytica rhodophyticola]|uniref:hypothetical protein n=1 Tax=Agarilytica rhodophyticola TaxID=1737490 RepID=UPI000B343DE6|nr:hypothetical protein [Agarilytica rhodophyticola]